MENRDRKSSPGGHKPGGHKQGSSPGQGGGDERQRGSDKPAARPAPSGVPNEGRKSEGQGSGPSKGDYEYKGGAQSTGGIPNPDDADDRDSAGSFRGTADDDADANDADEDDGDQAAGSGPNRDKDMNSVFHYPK
jgi:hypothetical protein